MIRLPQESQSVSKSGTFQIPPLKSTIFAKKNLLNNAPNSQQPSQTDSNNDFVQINRARM